MGMNGGAVATVLMLPDTVGGRSSAHARWHGPTGRALVVLRELGLAWSPVGQVGRVGGRLGPVMASSLGLSRGAP